MRKYAVIIEKDKDGVLTGSVDELPGCHTQAATFDELFARMKEAIELYLEVKKETDKYCYFVKSYWNSR